MDKSHKPHYENPNSHTLAEFTWTKNLIKRNPNISMVELYAKLKFNKVYNSYPCSLFKISWLYTKFVICKIPATDFNFYIQKD